MFLVRAEKSAEQPFQLGDVTVRRGEKYQGDISFANGDIVLPGTIICGKLPGKTMLITGGVHSGEYVAFRRVWNWERSFSRKKRLERS